MGGLLVGWWECRLEGRKDGRKEGKKERGMEGGGREGGRKEGRKEGKKTESYRGICKEEGKYWKVNRLIRRGRREDR